MMHVLTDGQEAAIKSLRASQKISHFKELLL